MNISSIESQFILALKEYPNLSRLDDLTFAIMFDGIIDEKYQIKYNSNNSQVFPQITKNDKDITYLCQFYAEKPFQLIDIIKILQIHVQKSNSTDSGNKNLTELQLAAKKLASDISSKTEQINGIQKRMIRCSSSVPDLYHLTKRDEVQMLKTEVVQMKKEIENLRADIALETKQFQEYLKQIANIIKMAKLPQT